MPLFLLSSAARYSVSSAARIFGACFLANLQWLSRRVLTIIAPPPSLDVFPSPKPGFTFSFFHLTCVCVSPATIRMYHCVSCYTLPAIHIHIHRLARPSPVHFRVSLIPSPPHAFPFSYTCCSAAEGEGVCLESSGGALVLVYTFRGPSSVRGVKMGYDAPARGRASKAQ
jgi:hypothetical protein